MGLLASLFGLAPVPSPDIASKLDLGCHFCSFDYRKNYSSLLTEAYNPALVISELFMFRSWVTQLGFRIFCSYPEITDRILYKVIEISIINGPGSLLLMHDVQIDRCIAGDYATVLQVRWHRYEDVFRGRQSREDQLASFPVCASVIAACGPPDPLHTMTLAASYLMQINAVKEMAISNRLLKR